MFFRTKFKWLTIFMGLTLIPHLSHLELLQAQSTAESNSKVKSIIKGNYERVFFDEDVTRIAIGNKELLSVELLNTREALVLGLDIGRTNVVVWHTSGKISDHSFLIEEDLSVLREILKDLDSRITVEMDTNREIAILRGTVSNITVMQRAVEIAENYMGSKSAQGRKKSDSDFRQFIVSYLLALKALQPSANEEVEIPETLETTSAATVNKTVINLLHIETQPDSLEKKIVEAIKPFTGSGVTVRRIPKGIVPSDDQDVFVLEGKVANQVTLVRILSIVARMVTGKSLRGNKGESLIRVLAEEGGGLFEGGSNGQRQQNSQGSSGSGSNGGVGGSGNSLIQSDIETNIARAKILDVAEGRILSFIEVSDLPLVRVNVQFFEVNRSEILNYSSNWGAFISNFDQPALLAAGVAPGFQTSPASVGTFDTTDIQNVLSSIGGNIGNQFQFVENDFALDTAFSLLEAKGLARRLSTPSLTVLAGEQARLTVGGEIPIQELFSPALNSNNSPGVFGSVRFRSFGISLNMRPQIDEHDMITLELAPSVSQPDQQLTSVLVSTTGAEQPTTAFESRSIMTSSRLRDGQTLMLGGLISRGKARDISQTPLLGTIPGIGWLFRNYGETDDDRELVILLNPTIVREPIPEMSLWAFAKPEELLESAGLTDQGKSPKEHLESSGIRNQDQDQESERSNSAE